MIRVFVLALFFMLLVASFAQAELKKVSANTFQSEDGGFTLVTTKEPQGVFLIHTPEKAHSMEDIQNLTDGEAQHLYLQFSESSGTYDRLYNADQEFELQGRFDVKLGSWNVRIDGPLGLVIVFPEQADSVDVFYGDQRKFFSNRKSATRKILGLSLRSPYVLSQGNLKDGDREVRPPLGALPGNSASCLDDNEFFYLTEKEHQSVTRNIPPSELVERLRYYKERNSLKRWLSQAVVVRKDGKLAVVFNEAENLLYRIECRRTFAVLERESRL